MTLLLRLFSFFIQSSSCSITALLSTVLVLKKVKTGGISCALNHLRDVFGMQRSAPVYYHLPQRYDMRNAARDMCVGVPVPLQAILGTRSQKHKAGRHSRASRGSEGELDR